MHSKNLCKNDERTAEAILELTRFSDTSDPLLTTKINHKISLPFNVRDLFLITLKLLRKAFIIEMRKGSQFRRVQN